MRVMELAAAPISKASNARPTLVQRPSNPVQPKTVQPSNALYIRALVGRVGRPCALDARGSVITMPTPPDLQRLVERFGGYHKISPEAWYEFDMQMIDVHIWLWMRDQRKVKSRGKRARPQPASEFI